MTLDERTLSLLTLALLALVAALAVWLVLLQRALTQLRTRLRRVLSDDATGGIDEVFDREIARVDRIAERLDAMNALQRELEQAAQRSLQRVGLVRFNPFPDTGGDQSFAIALLDAAGSGVVVSSLHSRSDTRVFAKQVVAGRSKHQLSDEEEDAIRRALSSQA